MDKSTFNNNIKPYGTTFLEDGSVEFAFWAPDAFDVKLCLEIDNQLQDFQMNLIKNGLFTLTTDKAKDGMIYGYKINNNIMVPDPASRYQPNDVHALSKLINPDNFNWENDNQWKGRPWEESIIYELHTGTFSKEGTFNAIKNKLDYFVSLGITAIELMPIAEFAGKRNWGYDGVLIYAPDSSYGTPEELKELIKAAHQKGIMVFLDVVYNHFGPDGNYLNVYAKSEFFDKRIKTPWGDAINFTNRYVRNFFIHNAIYWLNEYHFDGLRIDAIHAIHDESKPNIIEELAEQVKNNVDSNKQIHLVLENDDNQSKYLGELKNGKYEAQWNDDFHHCVHILTTGEDYGYYVDYSEKETPKSTAYYLARALTEGFSYQGERSVYRNYTLRGEKSFLLPLYRFINFIQNHDQIGNRAFGERIASLTNNDLLKAVAALYLLSPSIPLLFMGEEWGSKTPFYYFCDFNAELSSLVRIGRREEFAKFPQFSDSHQRELIPDPSAEETFLDSKLNWEDINEEAYKEIHDFYRSLLKIRKEKIIPVIGDIKMRKFEILTKKSFIVRWAIGKENQIKLIAIANFDQTPLKTSVSVQKENILVISKASAEDNLINNKILAPETVAYILA